MAFLKLNSANFGEYLREYKQTQFYPDKEIEVLKEVKLVHENPLKKFNIYLWRSELKKVETILHNIKTEIKMKLDNPVILSKKVETPKPAIRNGLSQDWQLFWAGAFITVFLATMPFVCQYGKDQATIEWKDERRNLYHKIDSLSTIIRSNSIPDSITKPK